MSGLLNDDLRECVAAALAPSHLPSLRRVDRAWRNAVDAHLRTTYSARLEHLLSHMRIRGTRACWLLRYAVLHDEVPTYTGPHGYVCAKCGDDVVEVGTCKRCKPVRRSARSARTACVSWVATMVCMTMSIVTFVTAVLLLACWTLVVHLSRV